MYSEYQNLQDAYFRTNVRREGSYLNLLLKTNGKNLRNPTFSKKSHGENWLITNWL